MIKSVKNKIVGSNVQVLFVALVLLFVFNNTTQAQCGIALRDVAVKEIGEATYLKDFRVRLEAGKNPKKPPAKEFTILLRKGTHYRFNIMADKECDDQVVLKLFDYSKPYGSNYDPSDGTTYQAFEFFCAKTQVYYLSMSFVEAKQGCAVTVVSFIGNY